MKSKLASVAVVGLALLLGNGFFPSGPGVTLDAAEQEAMADNPFLTESPLPYRLPPFDRIDESHYRPAFGQGMAEQIAEVEAIAALSEAPTFDNTILALERSGRLLDRVATTFFALSSAHTSDALDEIRSEVAPQLAAHTDRMLLNGELFARVETLHARRAALGLDAESIRLIEKYHEDFVRAGRAARRRREGADAGDQRRSRLAPDPLHAQRARRGERLGGGRGVARRARRPARRPGGGGRRGGGGARPRRTVRHPASQHERPAGAGGARRPGAARADHARLARTGQPGRRVRQPRGDYHDGAVAGRAVRDARLSEPRHVHP